MIYPKGMTFYGNRADQLASHIKEKILSKELSDPLPSSRTWCRELDVGRPTLLKALKILQHSGLLKTTARGAKIVPGRGMEKLSLSNLSSATPKGVKSGVARLPLTARFLYYGRNYKELQQGSKWFLELSWILQSHGIRLVLERCNAIRLKAIASHEPQQDELCFLHSLPVPYQRLFVQHQKPAVIVGYAGQDVQLPFVTPDLSNVVRHAALRLLRRGFRRLALINLATREEGNVKCVEGFHSACKEWSHQPVHTEVVRVWNDLDSQRSEMKRLAAKTKEPCGFIVFYPVSVGMLTTALLQRGLSIPGDAEVMAIEHSPEDMSFSVPVTLYGFPTHRFAKTALGICTRYFETGLLPTEGKIVDLDAPKEF